MPLWRHLYGRYDWTVWPFYCRYSREAWQLMFKWVRPTTLLHGSLTIFPNLLQKTLRQRGIAKLRSPFWAIWVNELVKRYVSLTNSSQKVHEGIKIFLADHWGIILAWQTCEEVEDCLDSFFTAELLGNSLPGFVELGILDESWNYKKAKCIKYYLRKLRYYTLDCQLKNYNSLHLWNRNRPQSWIGITKGG